MVDMSFVVVIPSFGNLSQEKMDRDF